MMTRGALARATACHIETIRYYERIGLMPEPNRTGGGHRVYGEDDARRLRFILRARELGFSIGELRALLGMVDGGDYTCGEVRDLSLRHLAAIRGKIADLRRLERTMRRVVDRCEGGTTPECPVIEALTGPARAGRRP